MFPIAMLFDAAGKSARRIKLMRGLTRAKLLPRDARCVSGGLNHATLMSMSATVGRAASEHQSPRNRISGLRPKSPAYVLQQTRAE